MGAHWSHHFAVKGQRGNRVPAAKPGSPPNFPGRSGVPPSVPSVLKIQKHAIK